MNYISIYLMLMLMLMLSLNCMLLLHGCWIGLIGYNLRLCFGLLLGEFGTHLQAVYACVDVYCVGEVYA